MIDALTGIDITPCLQGDGLVDLPKVVAQRNGLESAILPTQDTIEGVANIILVSSAKGGVGKSSMTVALAYQLMHMGAKVGILDADIYGPSMPLMLGMNQEATVHQDKIVPIKSAGLSMISIANLVGIDQDIVWRGPRASGMLKQMFTQTLWQEIDYLFIDMPPGTGDIQLTIAQTASVAGAVVVTTPHHVCHARCTKGYQYVCQGRYSDTRHY